MPCNENRNTHWPGWAWPALAMHYFQDSLLAALASLDEFESACSDTRSAYGL